MLNRQIVIAAVVGLFSSAQAETGKRTGYRALVLLALGLLASVVNGQEREDVEFQITFEPPTNQISAFVLGDLPELGGGDITRAVKLVEKEAFLWEVTISLPVNRTYTYQYYARNHAANLIGAPANGIPISEEFTDSTSTVQLSPMAKKMYYHSTIDPPTLHWRQDPDPAPYETLVMQEIGPGREAGELRWLACGFGEARRPIEFYLTNADETLRDPADPAETYLTPLDAFFLQDNNLFTYLPAPTVAPPYRHYDPMNPPSISTNNLLPEATRQYRVMLPRGYDQHKNRQYPVMYFHDGAAVWDPLVDPLAPCSAPGDPPCAYDLDGANVAEVIRLGQGREVVMVAIDVPGADSCEVQINRARDYVPQGDDVNPAGCGLTLGEAQNYVHFIITELKPHIDAQYRTLTDREHTGVAGASLGGLCSMYMGWDFGDPLYPDPFFGLPATFARVGSGSGSYQHGDSFAARVVNVKEPKREIRIYQDTGAFFDLYNVNNAFRDKLLSKSPEPYVVEGDHRWFVGFGQAHTIQEIGSRWPNMMTFLFPGTEEPNELLCTADLDCDANVGIVDFLALLAAWGPNPGHPADFDGDGVVGIVDFLALLANWGPCP